MGAASFYRFAIATSFLALLLISLASAAAPPYGKLSLSAAQLVGSSGQAVQLRGMSFYWSQWDSPSWWTAAVVKGLACNWNANVVRAAMAVEAAYGGYLKDSNTANTELNKVYTVVDAAIANGIYALVDWHETGNTAYTSQAVEFFGKVSKKYANVPNVLYEIFNEPTNEYTEWNTTLWNYHMAVIKAIRANDATAIIIAGTPKWSSGIDANVLSKPISGYKNVMYTLHWYPNGAAWQDYQRQSILTAKKKGFATFITEYGVAPEGGSVDSAETKKWWDWSDANKISYINWHVGSINEVWSAHQANTQPSQISSDLSLTTAGKLVKAKLRSVKNDVVCFSSG